MFSKQWGIKGNSKVGNYHGEICALRRKLSQQDRAWNKKEIILGVNKYARSATVVPRRNNSILLLNSNNENRKKQI